MLRHLVLAALTAAISAGAAAQGKGKPQETLKSPAAQAPRPWTKEPTTFLGIALGVPMSLPDCPIYKPNPNGVTEELDEGAAARLETACHMPDSPYERGMRMSLPTRKIANLPDLGFHYTVEALVVKGLVKEVHLKLAQHNFGKMIETLSARYGQPTTSATKSVQNSMGAVFEATDHVWAGKKLSIYAIERFISVDRSQVLILDPEVMKAEEAEKARIKADGAQKL